MNNITKTRLRSAMAAFALAAATTSSIIPTKAGMLSVTDHSQRAIPGFTQVDGTGKTGWTSSQGVQLAGFKELVKQGGKPKAVPDRLPYDPARLPGYTPDRPGFELAGLKDLVIQGGRPREFLIINWDTRYEIPQQEPAVFR